MPAGQVVSLVVRPKKGAPTEPRDAVRVHPGVGVEGDHQVMARGKHKAPMRELTLVESEALEAAKRDHDVEISHAQVRRNVLTRGVALNHLVGKVFRVGGVQVRGIKLCEPCGHLVKLTGDAAVKRALVHRGGLRAEILSEGVIRVGDPIDVTP